MNGLFIFQESIKTIGCTNPIGIELSTNVCRDEKKILTASRLFNEYFYNDKQTNDCPMPCHFINNIFTPMESNEDHCMWLKFQKYIKAQYIYLDRKLLMLVVYFVKPIN